MMNSKIYNANNELLVANAMPVVTRRTTTTTTQPTSYTEVYDDYGVSSFYPMYLNALFFVFMVWVICSAIALLFCGILIFCLLRTKSKKCKICGTKIIAKNNKFPQNCPKCGATLN